MSDPLVSSLNLAISNVYIYLGTLITIGGGLGGIINVIIFLSLRIYRQSSSAFYLTIVSVVNIGQLLTGLLSRVLINAVGVDWTQTSLAYCKFRNYLFQACGIIFPLCLCLVTIDQFLATSTDPQWQRWSNTQMAHRLSSGAILICLIYGIPYLIYYELIVLSSTGKSSCVITNAIFGDYYNNFHVPVLMCAVPICLTIVFGLLAYHNVKQLSHRTVPLIRRRHEVQLTIMVLVQVVFNIFATTPCFVVLTFASHTALTRDPVIAIKVRFAIAITTCFYYLYYAIPFYIYLCVSERFRKQVHHVFLGSIKTRWRRVTINEIAPHIQLQSLNAVPKLPMNTLELS